MRRAIGDIRPDRVTDGGKCEQPRKRRQATPLLGLLTLLLPIVLQGAAWAADIGGSLTGRVVLGAQGLPGLTVTATGPATAQAVTTLDGSYQFSGLPAGTYTVALTQDGLQGNPPLRTVVLSGAGVPGLDFLATPTAPLLPTIHLIPSATLLRPGETFTLRLTLTPGTQEPRADLYLSLVLPGSPLRPSTPWQANLLVPEVTDAPVFSHTVTGDELRGTYTWLAFFTRPGTLELLGPVASASVSLRP